MSRPASNYLARWEYGYRLHASNLRDWRDWPRLLLNPMKPSEQDCSAQRSPARPNDTRLSALAIAWSIQLPKDIRPDELIRQYPRIANRLALCWNDPVLSGRLLDSYIKDRRGKRKGFPKPVEEELLRMRKLFAAETVDEPVGHWNLQALSDR